MSKTATRPQAPVAPNGHQDTQPQNGNVGGSHVPNAAQSRSQDSDLRAELERVKANQAQLERQLAAQEQEKKRRAQPDRLDEATYRERYNFSDEFLEGGTTYLDAAVHIVRSELSEAIPAAIQQDRQNRFWADLEFEIPDWEAIYNSPDFQYWHLRVEPHQYHRLKAANESLRANAAIEVFRAFKQWARQQEAQQQAQHVQAEPVQQTAAMPPLPNHTGHYYANEPWDIPDYNPVERPELPPANANAQDPRHNMMHSQMMPRNSAPPPQTAQRGEVYDGRQVDEWMMKVARIPASQKTPEIRAQIAEFNRAKMEGRVRY